MSFEDGSAFYFLQSLGDHIDANWIDVGSLVSGLAYSILRHVRVMAPNAPFISVQTGLSFASGTALFPLLILVFTSISTDLERALLGASKLTLSVAGAVALFALLEDVGRPGRKDQSGGPA